MSFAMVVRTIRAHAHAKTRVTPHKQRPKENRRARMCSTTQHLARTNNARTQHDNAQLRDLQYDHAIAHRIVHAKNSKAQHGKQKLEEHTVCC